MHLVRFPSIGAVPHSGSRHRFGLTAGLFPHRGIPLRGDYRTIDGWIRLHTNAPHHRRVALSILHADADADSVSAAVARWHATDLEAAIVEPGGCAAKTQTRSEWEGSKAGIGVRSEPLIHRAPNGHSRSIPTIDDPTQPLRKIRVLDLTRVLAGPVSTRFLALMGADFLRVDPPWWEEPALIPDMMLGKRSVRLDLRVVQTREKFLDLLSGADVLVHVYRPGALDGLDLGHAVRHDARPGLIETSLSAYGWSGPWAGSRAFDSLVQMSTGIAEAGMRVMNREKPAPLPVQAIDHTTGYLMAYATIRSLTHALRRGQGSDAQLSLARTARLLTDAEPSLPGPGICEADENDFSAASELTSWGPASRIKAPSVFRRSVFRVKFRRGSSVATRFHGVTNVKLQCENAS